MVEHIQEIGFGFSRDWLTQLHRNGLNHISNL